MVFRECGCRTYMTDHPNLFVPMVEYCPMHKAAPKLLETLKVLLDDRHNWEAWLDAENIISKLERNEEPA